MRLLLSLAVLTATAASAATIVLESEHIIPLPEFWVQVTFATLPMSSESASGEEWTCSPGSCELGMPFQLELPPLILPPGATVTDTYLNVLQYLEGPSSRLPVNVEITTSRVAEDCDGVPCPFSPASFSPVKLPVDAQYWDGNGNALYGGFPAPFTLDELRAGVSISGSLRLLMSNGDTIRHSNGFNATTVYRWSHQSESLPVRAVVFVDYQTAATPEPGAAWMLGTGLLAILAVSRLRRSSQ